MKQLNQMEVQEVSGGDGVGGAIGFIVASAWATTVAGAAAGSLVPGAGTLAGGAVGFGLGVAIGVGYLLATS